MRHLAQETRDADDGRGTGPGLDRDLAIGFGLLVQQPGDSPAFGEGADLGRGAQIGEEGVHLRPRLQRQQGVVQRRPVGGLTFRGGPGGGVWKGRKAKAVIPGGISMGLMTESELDTPLDFAGPGKVGCLGLGTAAVVVIDETVSIVDFLHNSCRFFAHESCGQCTPCREGTSWSLRMLERIKAGKGRLKDLDLLAEIGNTMGMMPGSTICGLADGAAWPIKNAIKKFRGEFEDYIKQTNPQGWMVTDPVPALQIVGSH